MIRILTTLDTKENGKQQPKNRLSIISLIIEMCFLPEILEKIDCQMIIKKTLFNKNNKFERKHFLYFCKRNLMSKSILELQGKV